MPQEFSIYVLEGHINSLLAFGMTFCQLGKLTFLGQSVLEIGTSSSKRFLLASFQRDCKIILTH